MNDDMNALDIVDALGGLDALRADPTLVRVAQVAAKIADQDGIDAALTFCAQQAGGDIARAVQAGMRDAL